MVVPLEAVTEKVTEAKFGTLWLEGWTVITAGGPWARQRPATRKPKKSRQRAVFFNRLLVGSLFVNTLGEPKATPVPRPKNGMLASRESFAHLAGSHPARGTGRRGRHICDPARCKRSLRIRGS